jgi:hypothetical protein
MKQNKMGFYKILAVIGSILLVIGIPIVVYHSYLKTLQVTTFRELPIEVNLTDENPIFIREIQLLSQDEKVHVNYNFSRGGLVIGLIEKEKWEALVKEGQEKNITKLIKYSNAYIIIPEKNVTVITRDLRTGETKTIIQRLPERGEVLFKLKLAGIKMIYIENIYVSKIVSGNISGYIEYEVGSYPYKYEYDFQITIGWVLITIGSFMLAIAGIRELLR